MACACSKTSPSRHPPLTDPAIFPDWLIAIREPAGRGALPQVLITVATATRSPLSSHALTSGMTSRISQSLGRISRGCCDRRLPADRAPAGRLEQQRAEGLEVGQVVGRQEIVDKRLGDLSSQCQWFVACVAQ